MIRSKSRDKGQGIRPKWISTLKTKSCLLGIWYSKQQAEAQGGDLSAGTQILSIGKKIEAEVFGKDNPEQNQNLDQNLTD